MSALDMLLELENIWENSDYWSDESSPRDVARKDIRPIIEQLKKEELQNRLNRNVVSAIAEAFPQKKKERHIGVWARQGLPKGDPGK